MKEEEANSPETRKSEEVSTSKQNKKLLGEIKNKLKLIWIPPITTSNI